MRILLEAGSDKEKNRKDGMTALGIASAKGQLKVVRLLIEHDADVHSAGHRLRRLCTSSDSSVPRVADDA